MGPKFHRFQTLFLIIIFDRGKYHKVSIFPNFQWENYPLKQTWHLTFDLWHSRFCVFPMRLLSGLDVNVRTVSSWFLKEANHRWDFGFSTERRPTREWTSIPNSTERKTGRNKEAVRTRPQHHLSNIKTGKALGVPAPGAPLLSLTELWLTVPILHQSWAALSGSIWGTQCRFTTTPRSLKPHPLATPACFVGLAFAHQFMLLGICVSWQTWQLSIY